MLKEKHIPFILLSLIILYFSQGALYTSGSIISQIALFLILGISSIFFIKTLFTKNKELFYNAWSALLLINVIGFTFTGSLSNTFHFGMFKGILISSLPFYPFYYFAKKGTLTSRHLIVLFLIMLPVSILQFYYNKEQVLFNRISNNQDVVNNAAYMFVNLIPFLFLFKRRKIVSVVGMLILIFFIIQGAKRGAMLVGSFGLVLFLFYQLRTIDKKHRLKGYAITLLGIIVMIYYTYGSFLENEFLIKRMELLSEGGVSGRDIIYANIFNNWYNSDNLFNFLFGYGFAGSQKLAYGSFAHNDWLELLSNFGILGVSIYMILFYSSFKLLRKSNWNPDKKIIFTTVVSMWFLITLFSMGYTSTDGYLRALLLAFLIGSKEKDLIRTKLKLENENCNIKYR